jgi:hypothetical protein
MITVLFHPPHRDFWVQLFFILSQGGLALWQAGRFAAGIAVSHTFWAAAVLAEIILLSFFSKHKWAMAAKLILERIIVFNPVLNLIRHRPFFYTNASGSWLDGHLPHGWYMAGFIASLLGLELLYWHGKNKLGRMK